MRDGVELAADAYQGVEDKPRPALVALSPYGKELQALALTTPPQRRPSPMWDGCIEAGDIARIVKEDYVHVIGDLRGSGHSGGEHIGNYNAGGVSLGQDAYDFIEWVAAQPWCDGNVGMIGISYFGSMQVLAAAERPPHLKAIFVSGGHYDFYETTYHGGIMWFMPRAAREGRGGDSGWAFTDGVKSRMIEKYSPEELKELVAKRLEDPDVAAWPNLVHVLNYPKNHEAWFDIVMNELDGDWYEERNPDHAGPEHRHPGVAAARPGPRLDPGRHHRAVRRAEGPQEAGHRPVPADAVAPLHRGARQDVPLVRLLDQGHRQRRHGRAGRQRLRRGLPRGGDRRAVAAEGHRVHDPLPAPAPQAVHRARADGRRVRRPGRLLPGAADGDRQGGDHQLVHRPSSRRPRR